MRTHHLILVCVQNHELASDDALAVVRDQIKGLKKILILSRARK
jgi:hypothetical protein